MGSSKKFLVASRGWPEVIFAIKESRSRGFKFAYCKHTHYTFKVARYLTRLGIVVSYSKKKDYLEILVNQSLIYKFNKISKYQGVCR